MPIITKREPRRALRLPVRVSGRDAAGAPFTEDAHTLNISGGGLCFEAARAVPAGARLALRIEVPPALRHHFGGRALYGVTAVVCRLEHREGEAVYRVGVRFVGELEG